MKKSLAKEREAKILSWGQLFVDPEWLLSTVGLKRCFCREGDIKQTDACSLLGAWHKLMFQEQVVNAPHNSTSLSVTLETKTCTSWGLQQSPVQAKHLCRVYQRAHASEGGWRQHDLLPFWSPLLSVPVHPPCAGLREKRMCCFPQCIANTYTFVV